MPYISKRERVLIDVEANPPTSPGQLNYAISRMIHEYVLRNGRNYTVMSAARAAALDATDEFYRTVMVPYEDQKRRENGPVSLLDEVMEQQG